MRSALSVRPDLRGFCLAGQLVGAGWRARCLYSVLACQAVHMHGIV
jgi:hypothetical protein